MRIGERTHQCILYQIVGIGGFPPPAAHRAPQERDLVNDLALKLRGTRPGAPFRPVPGVDFYATATRPFGASRAIGTSRAIGAIWAIGASRARGITAPWFNVTQSAPLAPAFPVRKSNGKPDQAYRQPTYLPDRDKGAFLTCFRMKSESFVW